MEQWREVLTTFEIRKLPPKPSNQRKKLPIIRRTTPAKPRDFNLACFDIETDELFGKFLVGCVSTAIGEYQFFSTPESMLDYMLELRGYIIYAHNGKGYDFKYLSQTIMAKLRHTYHIEPTRQGETIIGYTLEELEIYNARIEKAKGHKSKRMHASGPTAVQLRDSLPLLNCSLYSATLSFAPEYTKLKGDVDFEGGEIFDPSNEKHMNYLKRDCDGLLAVMHRFYELCYEMFGVYPSWTAGGTAMKAWKCHIPEGHTYCQLKSREKEDFIRKAYYGGYVFPGTDTLTHENVKSVDFNGAYAGSMLQGVPHGSGEWTHEFHEDKPGFYHVRVQAPATTMFPVIGKHSQKGLLWPLGTYETHCSIEEIKYARSKGYTFTCIIGIFFQTLTFPFNEFVGTCQEIERTLDPSTGKVDPARKGIAKQLRNSLYGKFGMKRMMEKLVIGDEFPEGARTLFDDNGMPVVGMYAIEEENEADYLLIQWACYITLWQRLRLFKGMDACKTPFYCDTDSIKAPATYVDEAIASGALEVHPTTYGCVKDEGTFLTFQVLAPKTYHGTTTKGHHEMKAKGAPARELAKAVECPLCQADRGIYTQIHFTSGHSIEKTLRNPDAPLSEVRKRSISNIENSYGWKIDTRTRAISPVTLHE
jgi:DNA polymerase type B, organellar and viral